MLTTLIVDDSNTELECILFLIKKYNFPISVSTANNGKTALLFLQDNHVDILLTDIKMPFMDGLELSKEALSLQSDLDIIIISGYGEFDYAKTAISLGVSGYLLKPINPVEFQEIMSKKIDELSSKQHQKEIIDIINSDSDSELTSNKIKFVKQYIYEHYDTDLYLELLAQKACIRPDYLSRLFKKETGCNLNKFIKAYRMKKAKELLKKTQMKINSISIAVGYPNCSYFCQCFNGYYGISPEKCRQKDN